jgi:hypothetical protein
MQLDGLNIIAPVPANMVNPLFLQQADDPADTGSGVVVLPSGLTPPIGANVSAKADDVSHGSTGWGQSPL